MAGVAGLEPANDGIKIRCLTDLAIPLWNEASIKLAQNLKKMKNERRFDVDFTFSPYMKIKKVSQMPKF